MKHGISDEGMERIAQAMTPNVSTPSDEWTDEQHQVWDAVEHALEQIQRGEYSRQRGKKPLRQFTPSAEGEFLEDLRQQYMRGEVDAETVMATLANPEIWNARFGE